MEEPFHFFGNNIRFCRKEDLPYFAVYNVHCFAQIFEGKIRIRIIHGIMITHHGHNDGGGHSNPTYNTHRKVGAHYTWQNTAFYFSFIFLLERGGREKARERNINV